MGRVEFFFKADGAKYLVFDVAVEVFGGGEFVAAEAAVFDAFFGGVFVSAVGDGEFPGEAGVFAGGHKFDVTAESVGAGELLTAVASGRCAGFGQSMLGGLGNFP